MAWRKPKLAPTRRRRPPTPSAEGSPRSGPGRLPGSSSRPSRRSRTMRASQTQRSWSRSSADLMAMSEGDPLPACAGAGTRNGAAFGPPFLLSHCCHQSASLPYYSTIAAPSSPPSKARAEPRPVPLSGRSFFVALDEAVGIHGTERNRAGTSISGSSLSVRRSSGSQGVAIHARTASVTVSRFVSN